MQVNGSNRKRTYALIVAVLVLATVSVAAWWPPRFIKAMTTPPLETGVAAPQFELASLSGENVSLAQFEGQAVLLKFWSVG
jgi:cytochrome oxidase Cu insertion factor (SCO1/SenC/PrrC family)